MWGVRCSTLAEAHLDFRGAGAPLQLQTHSDGDDSFFLQIVTAAGNSGGDTRLHPERRGVVWDHPATLTCWNEKGPVLS